MAPLSCTVARVSSLRGVSHKEVTIITTIIIANSFLYSCAYPARAVSLLVRLDLSVTLSASLPLSLLSFSLCLCVFWPLSPSLRLSVPLGRWLRLSASLYVHQ